MISLVSQSLLFVILAVVCLSVRADDDAIKNLQIGMQGLAQAGQDPALLAQLLQDMQDPELMAEAKKLMDNPEFKKEMKKFQNAPQFKDTMKKTSELLKDPNMAAAAEAKLETMAKIGAQELKRGAGVAMEEAMQAALTNPDVMKEMARMVKDPNFQQQLDAMAKDPQFQNYVNAMQDMMKDPSKKARFDAASNAIKAKL